MSQSRRAAPRRLRILATAAAVLVAAVSIADAAPADEAPHGGVHIIPAECLVFLSVPADARDDGAWLNANTPGEWERIARELLGPNDQPGRARSQ